MTNEFVAIRKLTHTTITQKRIGFKPYGVLDFMGARNMTIQFGTIFTNLVTERTRYTGRAGNN